MNEIMNGVRVKVLLFSILMCLAGVSAIYAPEAYARARDERSRKRLAQARSMDPSTDTGLNFVALVTLYGYPAEEHIVTTSDGYRLRLHRISGSPRSSQQPRKPVVYFQHGILASSDCWILFGPDKDLAYMLADSGYDVWLGNARGNTYSRSHVSLSPNTDPKFWQFSFHEIAVYDVPAMIDYILQMTGEKSVAYIGHSMGTTISYILLSMRPEYNNKVNLAVNLAPVVFWDQGVRPFVGLLKPFFPIAKSFVEGAGFNEILPLTSLNKQISKFACKEGSTLQPICLIIAFTISGFNPKQLNYSVQDYIYSYLPAGVSRQTLLHYSQHLLTGEFRLYDYGLVQNFAKYQRSKPPLYDLSKVTAPVILIYGQGDSIVVPENVFKLAGKLRNVVSIEEVPDTQFSHLDFLFATDIKRLLNDRVLRLIEKFSVRDNYL